MSRVSIIVLPRGGDGKRRRFDRRDDDEMASSLTSTADELAVPSGRTMVCVRARRRVLASLGLAWCTACAAITGLDGLQKVACVTACDGAADSPDAIGPLADGPAIQGDIGPTPPRDDGLAMQGDEGPPLPTGDGPATQSNGSPDVVANDAEGASDAMTSNDAVSESDSTVSDGGAASAHDASDARDLPDVSDGSNADTGAGLDAKVDSSPDASAGPITFVQIATATNLGTLPSQSVTFAQPQQAGDLIVVAIGWTDAISSVATVTDTAGNTYRLAIGPTRLAPDLSQSIYYASAIAAAGAGTNRTKVTFSPTASSIDMRAAEYSGLGNANLDVTSGASGVSAAASSGNATIAAARELLFGAGMCSQNYSAPSAGFTQRIVTANGDIAEDRIANSAGTYAAGGVLPNGSVEWVMQLATFR